MPDNERETLSIMDIYEKITKLEAKLDLMISTVNALANNGIIKEEPFDITKSPFYNPDTHLLDMKYYRDMHDTSERKRP